jgi:four helix bundle protein
MQRKYDLGERLIEFACKCLRVAEKLPNTAAGRHISGQLIRSGSSPALHYGEAQAAESSNDFVHKMKVCLKELKESFNSLRIVGKMEWYERSILLEIQNENNELISIFVTSIKTAQKNKQARKKSEGK